MLEELMTHTDRRISRQRALEILEAQANPGWTSDWYLVVLLVLYGFLVSTYGTQPLVVFLCLATCIAASNYRNRRRSAELAKAVGSLVAYPAGKEVTSKSVDHNNPVVEKPDPASR